MSAAVKPKWGRRLPRTMTPHAGITGGTWVLREQGEPVAVEEWSRTDTPEGPIWASRLRSSFPWPHEAALAVALTPDLKYREVSLEVEQEGQAPSVYEGKPDEGLWIALRRLQGEESHGFYDWDDRSEIDLPTSPLLTMLTLKRLGIPVGGYRELEVYTIDPFTLAMGKVRVGFERLEDTDVRCAAGTFPGRHYRYINGLTGTTSDLLTDEEDNLLAYGGAWELMAARREDPHSSA